MIAGVRFDLDEFAPAARNFPATFHGKSPDRANAGRSGPRDDDDTFERPGRLTSAGSREVRAGRTPQELVPLQAYAGCGTTWPTTMEPSVPAQTGGSAQGESPPSLRVQARRSLMAGPRL